MTAVDEPGSEDGVAGTSGRSRRGLEICSTTGAAIAIVLLLTGAISKLTIGARVPGAWREAWILLGVPDRAATWMWWAVPAGEVWIALTLLAARSRRAGGACAIATGLLFVAWHGFSWWFYGRTDVPCGCGGVVAPVWIAAIPPALLAIGGLLSRVGTGGPGALRS